MILCIQLKKKHIISKRTTSLQHCRIYRKLPKYKKIMNNNDNLQLTKSFKLQAMFGTRGAKKEKLTILKSLESTTQLRLTPLPCLLTLVIKQVFNTVNETTANQLLSLNAPNMFYWAKSCPLTKPSSLVVVRVSMESFSVIPDRKLGNRTSFIYIQRTKISL